MLLRELVDAPGLRLRLLLAPQGALERPVRRALTTDLLEPTRYLSGGELVLTGLNWRRSAADSETFVRSLVDGGAIALAAGDALLGSVPEDLVEACRRHGLPLVEVPEEISFADVVEHCAAATGSPVGARMSASLVRQREMLSAIASGRTLDEVAARVSAETGHVIRVVTTTGRSVVPGREPLAGSDVDRVVHAYLTAPRLPVTVGEAAEALTAFPVGSVLGSRLASWLVVVDGDGAGAGGGGGELAETVGEFAAIAALDRSRHEEGLRAARRIADDVLALLESGGSQRELEVRLAQAGVDRSEALVAVVAGFVDLPDQLEVVRMVVEDVALQLGTAVVASGRDERVVGLLPAAAGADDLLREAFGRLAPGLGGASLVVGVSTPVGPDAVAGAVEEARFACRLAEARRIPVSVVTADEVTSHVLLLASVPDEVRRTFAARVLGRVLEYDARTGAGLVDTLEAFLACSGSWTRTAEALHVHVNTVRYRIERVEQLTGRSLARLEDRVDVFLALRSR
ncbi:MAG TPA: helix-turn-helix domain-containing protein [Nocardioidaceae bacterium]|nr:helix-turn-helix domain-containing protein [Nocardioidaceae bacterium]